MAMGTVDVHISTHTILKAHVRILPVGHCPDVLGPRRRKVAFGCPAGQLVLHTITVGEVAVQVLRPRTDGHRYITGLVAGEALSFRRDPVIRRSLGTVIIDPGDGCITAIQVQHGFGLFVVPDVVCEFPLAIPFEQQAGLDDPAGIGRQHIVVVEGLDEHGAVGEVEQFFVAVVSGLHIGGHPNEAELVGIVREERVYGRVGYYTRHRSLQGHRTFEEAIIREFR